VKFLSILWGKSTISSLKLSFMKGYLKVKTQGL